MKHFASRIALVCAIAALIGICSNPPAAAQETKPATGSAVEAETEASKSDLDGFDRPTTYPKIRFSKDDPANANAAEGRKKLKSRVYMLDLSDVMAASITIDGVKEVTRLEHMVAQMDKTLDSLGTRRDIRFNIVTFGSVQDFASGGAMQEASADTSRKAKDWLKGLVADGETDVYSILQECFAQEPENAVLMVGGMPGKPAGVSEERLKPHATPGDFILSEVRRWRAAGRTTTLDICGVGLSGDDREYYKKLAGIAGGTYLDS